MSKLQPTYFRRFWGLLIFEKTHNVSTVFGLWDEKSKDFSRKNLFRVFATGYRASRRIRWGKVISLTKKFYSFLYHFWRLSNFFVVLQVAFFRCVKTPIYVCRKKLGKRNIKKTVIPSISDFVQKKLGLPAKQ